MVLASPHLSQRFVQLETYSLRLLRLQLYVLLLYNLSAEIERSKTTTFGKLALLDLFILLFKTFVKFFL